MTADRLAHNTRRCRFTPIPRSGPRLPRILFGVPRRGVFHNMWRPQAPESLQPIDATSKTSESSCGIQFVSQTNRIHQRHSSLHNTLQTRPIDRVLAESRSGSFRRMACLVRPPHPPRWTHEGGSYHRLVESPSLVHHNTKCAGGSFSEGGCQRTRPDHTTIGMRCQNQSARLCPQHCSAARVRIQANGRASILLAAVLEAVK